MNDFQENILDHYRNPRNFGKPEWHYTSIGHVQNISCGDDIRLYVEIENGTLKKLAFEGEGCSLAIASASIITEEFKNTDISKIRKLFDEDYVKKYIGIELTRSRRKCALLALDALREVIASQ